MPSGENSVKVLNLSLKRMPIIDNRALGKMGTSSIAELDLKALFKRSWKADLKICHLILLSFYSVEVRSTGPNIHLGL